MQLHTLAEAPSAMEISSNGYSYTLSKAGLSGIIPTSAETRSGMAQISLMIESVFAKNIYQCFERMWTVIIENLNLKFDWRLEMFGTLAKEKEEIEEARNAMTLGILPATLRYLALYDLSVFDDMSISDSIISMGVLDRRIPLRSSYQSSEKEENVTVTGKKISQEEETEIIEDIDEGGRPESEGVTSDGQEQDSDEG